MATDRYSRVIDYLRISITDRCNLSCVYCMPGRKPKRFEPDEVLTTDEIIRLARIAREFGVRSVRLTGGEPLLRDDIVHMVGALKSLGIPELSLTTNGVKLGHMASALKSAGLDRVNVSLDTMNPERFREVTGCGEIESVLTGIAEAERAGLDPIKLNMVPIRGINDDEVVAFARMTLDSARHVRFIEFMPSGREDFWDEKKCVTSAEVRSRIEAELGPLEERHFRGRGPSRNFHLNGGKGIIGFISAVSHSFCYHCNRLRLTAVGKLKPCLFSKTEIDLKGPMRHGADDEELRRIFALAIDVKPEGNYLREPRKNAIDSMSSIGG